MQLLQEYWVRFDAKSKMSIALAHIYNYFRGCKNDMVKVKHHQIPTSPPASYPQYNSKSFIGIFMAYNPHTAEVQSSSPSPQVFGGGG